MVEKYENVRLDVLTKDQSKKLIKAFELLKKKEPSIWEKSLTLKCVKIRDKKSYDNELFPKNRRWVCGRMVVDKNTVDYLTSLLLHETVHLKQYDRGVRNIAGRAEKSAYTAQIKFLKKIGRPKYAKGVMEQFYFCLSRKVL